MRVAWVEVPRNESDILTIGALMRHAGSLSFLSVRIGGKVSNGDISAIRQN